MAKTITKNSWVTGRELVKLLKILPSGIFDLLKAGLQAYSRDGIDKIINLYSLKPRRKYSRGEIRRQLDLEQGDIGTQTVLAKPGVWRAPLEKELTKEEKEQEEQIRHESQPLDTYDVPEGCIAISFTLSPGKKKREKQIEEAMDFQFKRTDIEKFQDEHSGLFSEEAVMLEFVEGERTDKKPVEQDKVKELTTHEDFIIMDINSLRNIRNATLEFIDFCMRFNTSCDQDKGGDTNPLSDKQTEFKKILEQQGPFMNHQINHLIDEINGNAIDLQRQIGRQTSSKMSDDQRLSISDERYALVSRLIEIRELVKLKFDKLIIEDKTTGQRPAERDEIKELTTHEDFIRNLRISYESDYEIKIQVPRRSPVTCSWERIGFWDEKAKPWKTFLEILQNPSHVYNIGPAYIYSPDGSKKIKKRNSSYDRERKRLEEINKKLIDFFNNNYPVNIPEGYKLYERCQSQRKRGYSFKFQVVDTTTMDGKLESEYNSYTKDQLINKIKELGKKYIEILKFKDDEVEANNFLEMFNIAAAIAIQKDWITEGEIKDMLDLNKYNEVYSHIKEKDVKIIDHS